MDEVARNLADARRQAEYDILDELWSLVSRLSGSACYGCAVDHPSQLQHDWCLLATTNDKIRAFREKAFQLLQTSQHFCTYYGNVSDKLNLDEAKEVYFTTVKKIKQYSNETLYQCMGFDE